MPYTPRSPASSVYRPPQVAKDTVDSLLAFAAGHDPQSGAVLHATIRGVITPAQTDVPCKQVPIEALIHTPWPS